MPRPPNASASFGSRRMPYRVLDRAVVLALVAPGVAAAVPGCGECRVQQQGLVEVLDRAAVLAKLGVGYLRSLKAWASSGVEAEDDLLQSCMTGRTWSSRREAMPRLLKVRAKSVSAGRPGRSPMARSHQPGERGRRDRNRARRRTGSAGWPGRSPQGAVGLALAGVAVAAAVEGDRHVAGTPERPG